jgi:hypothetical protein
MFTGEVTHDPLHPDDGGGWHVGDVDWREALAPFEGRSVRVTIEPSEEEDGPVGEGWQRPIICATCMDIHGRDTSQAVSCSTCKRIVGCFWHGGFSKHIRACHG